jgi:hypothetical protein
LFIINFATTESIQRTMWTITLIKYEVYRDILTRAVEDGLATT